jgi:predicted nucleotidyltransferase
METMISQLSQRKPEVARLCEEHGVRRLTAFGSAVTGAFSPESSDFDFVVAFRDTRSADYANRYYDFAEALERLLGRKVDLVTDRSIRRPSFRRAIESANEVIYES